MSLTDAQMVKIEQELHDEIETVERKLADIDRRTGPLQDDVYEAENQAEKSGKQEDQARATRMHDRLIDLIQAGTNTSLRLQILRQPEELERRIMQASSTWERIGKMTETQTEKKPPKPTAKDQGFPDYYLSDNGNFYPGGDARAKSDLIACVLGIDSKDSIYKGTAAEAQKLIDVRGWGDFLERKRGIVEDKAEKAATRAAEKQAAAEERAAQKKADAEAKAAAKADRDAAKADRDAQKGTDKEASGQAKPDPKPTSTRGRSRSRAAS